MKIQDIRALEILDSRGNPTVYVEVVLDNGLVANASVPSGASTGEREALELRDNDARYCGKGVMSAVSNIENIIKPKLLGLDPAKQVEIDKIMLQLDGTENKSNLGANAILGVSMAVCRAGAMSKGIPLYLYINELFSKLVGESIECIQPVPMMNVINGGCHADNGLDVQEFMIQPRGFENFSQGLRAGCEIFHKLKSILKSKNLATSVGDEGGFAPLINDSKSALDLLIEAITSAGYDTDRVKICLDVAGSELYKNDKYRLDGSEMGYEGVSEYFGKLIENYPIVSIEDALAENDASGWKYFTDEFKDKIQIVGDDLFTTNEKILARGIKTGLANSILIKINQIGSISETLNTMALARKSGYSSISSHRSGETSDDFIADLAVGTGCGQIKTGSLSRTDRIAKYNRLLWIEKFAGVNKYFKMV